MRSGPGDRPASRVVTLSHNARQLRDERSSRVGGSQPLIDGDERSLVFGRQKYKVSVGDLAVPDDSRRWYIQVQSIVRPEFVSRKSGNRSQQKFCGVRGRVCAGAQMAADQRALGYRARCKSVSFRNPAAARAFRLCSGVASAIRTLQSSR